MSAGLYFILFYFDKNWESEPSFQIASIVLLCKPNWNLLEIVCILQMKFHIYNLLISLLDFNEIYPNFWAPISPINV